MHDPRRITVVGAGLAGSLLAVLFARRGFEVDVFERNPDQRTTPTPAGRSINLALAERGRHALRQAGLIEKVDRFAIPMRGRMLHEPGRPPRLQRYGSRPGEVIWSVHRARLNRALLDAADQAGVALHFDRRLVDADFERRLARYASGNGTMHELDFDVMIGADGAGSAVRAAVMRVRDLGLREVGLDHGYKELGMPAADGEFALEPEALHIWPRGDFMMIALPNPDKSFTATLFLPETGDPSFAQLQSWPAQRAFMQREFPDAVALMPRLNEDFARNPVGFLGTVYLDRWHLEDRVLLVGDAAHAIVPFHGQGMNAAFEDCVILADMFTGPDQDRVFEAFFQARKPDADAIAQMAMENYAEMRAAVRDPRFHLKKELEWALEERLPGRFIPRYSMVMFHRIPYREAHERGAIQADILERFTSSASGMADIDLEEAVAVCRARLPEYDPAARA